DTCGHAGVNPGRPHGRGPVVAAVNITFYLPVIFTVVIAGIIVPPVASRSTPRRHRSPADAAMRAWHGAPRVVAHAGAAGIRGALTPESDHGYAAATHGQGHTPVLTRAPRAGPS